MSETIVNDSDRSPDDGFPPASTGSDVPGRGRKGRLGPTAVVLTVMAYLAPLAAAAGYIPLVIGFGNGLGAPLVFLVCGAVLALFSFGYLAMVRQVPRPGAFYAYVSAGLGKRVGLGSGALTLSFYLMSAMGFYIFGGVSLSNLLRSNFGLDLPWWLYVAVLGAIVFFCAYRGLEFNVRILGFVVALEITIIAAFNVVALIRGVPSGYSAEPFTWGAFTSGSVAVAALFAIAFFVGFESTAIYREEVRNPRRTIPLATYAVIATISLFYFVTAYCLIISIGTDTVVTDASADPAGTFNIALAATLGSAFTQIVAVLVVTSVLASELAMVNAMTRYVYSFGVDRVFPKLLGAVHKRHGSPYRAALLTNTLTLAGVVAVAVSGLDPQVGYGTLSGVMVFGFEAMMLLVSLSAIVYFRRNRGSGEPLWSTLIAPLLSIACFGWLLYFSAARLDLLLGTPTLLSPILFTILGTAFVVGFVYACVLAARKPDVFARIGRAVD
ncbi:APC family permease [Rhodococcus jostii]|uniref:APC family permease n=1 Tax=Rhodococcus jostii TaxID=132919 RepID=A0ABU4CTT7_RHOJO|nr:APC family permease [Rhodococcus jostii]MDV6286974.1 APC family permease [Rhodococcus jostii]